MNVIKQHPPLIDEIDRAFHVRDKAVIYAWGNSLYVPHHVDITDALIEHERVHGKRQLSGAFGTIEDWWRRYIENPSFRLAEEILAHRAEYDWHARQPGADRPLLGWRSKKQYHLHFIASRLCSPMYGGLCSLSEAKKLITV